MRSYEWGARSARRAAAALFVVAAPLHAQAPSAGSSTASDSAAAPAPRVQVGAGTGSLSMGDGRNATGVMALVTVRPATWWAFSVAPTMERFNATLVTSTTGTNAGTTSASGPPASGLADLPISLVTQHAFDRAGQPSIVASLSGLLPTGNAARGLGTGRGAASLSLGASVQAADPVEFNVSASREVTSGGSPTALQADVNTQLGDHGGLDVGWSRDVIGLAGAPAYASVSVGTSWQLGHGLVLAADWSRSTVGAGATRQVLQGVSVGVGMVVPSFVPSNGDPAEARGHSGASGRQRVFRSKSKGKTKTKGNSGV